MTWFKHESSWSSHPKFQALRSLSNNRYGAAGMMFWDLVGHCSTHLTDGVFSYQTAMEILGVSNRKRALSDLLFVGLVAESSQVLSENLEESSQVSTNFVAKKGSKYVICGFHKWNRSKASVVKERKGISDRVSKHRSKSAGECNGVTNATVTPIDKSRGEERREELKKQSKKSDRAAPLSEPSSGDLDLLGEPVEKPDKNREASDRIFEHWKATLGKSRSRPTPGRMKKIGARLADGYSEAECIEAISSCARSEWHVANGHTSIDLIFRSAAKLEEFRDRPAPRTGRGVPPAWDAPEDPGVVARRAAHEAYMARELERQAARDAAKAENMAIAERRRRLEADEWKRRREVAAG